MSDRTFNTAWEPELGTAVCIKLTPEIKQALLTAHAAGQQLSLKLTGDHGPAEACLAINGKTHSFSVSEQSRQDVLQLPGAHGGDARVLASVQHKLGAKRTIDDTAGKLRAAGEQAQRKRQEGATVQLTDAGSKARLKQGVPASKTVTVQRAVTPPAPAITAAATAQAPHHRSVTPPPLPTSNATRPPTAASPPVPSTQAAALQKKVQQPLKPAAAKATSAAAAAGANGAKRGTTPPPSSVSPAPSPEVPGAGVAATAAAPASGTTAAPAPAALSIPTEPPRPAVIAAKHGELQLVLVALLCDAPKGLPTSAVSRLIDAAYRMARKAPEAKEYVKRVTDAATERAPPGNRLVLKEEVWERDMSRLTALVNAEGNKPSPPAQTEAAATQPTRATPKPTPSPKADADPANPTTQPAKTKKRASTESPPPPGTGSEPSLKKLKKTVTAPERGTGVGASGNKGVQAASGAAGAPRVANRVDEGSGVGGAGGASRAAVRGASDWDEEDDPVMIKRADRTPSVAAPVPVPPPVHTSPVKAQAAPAPQQVQAVSGSGTGGIVAPPPPAFGSKSTAAPRGAARLTPPPPAAAAPSPPVPAPIASLPSPPAVAPHVSPDKRRPAHAAFDQAHHVAAPPAGPAVPSHGQGNGLAPVPPLPSPSPSAAEEGEEALWGAVQVVEDSLSDAEEYAPFLSASPPSPQPPTVPGPDGLAALEEEYTRYNTLYFKVKQKYNRAILELKALLHTAQQAADEGDAAQATRARRDLWLKGAGYTPILDKWQRALDALTRWLSAAQRIAATALANGGGDRAADVTANIGLARAG